MTIRLILAMWTCMVAVQSASAEPISDAVAKIERDEYEKSEPYQYYERKIVTLPSGKTVSVPKANTLLNFIRRCPVESGTFSGFRCTRIAMSIVLQYGRIVEKIDALEKNYNIEAEQSLLQDAAVMDAAFNRFMDKHREIWR